MATYDFVVNVSNIPGDATRYDLAMMFASCGTIRNAGIFSDNNPNRPGHGFVEFQTKQGAENAVRDMNGAEMKGHVLRVEFDKYYGGKLNKS
uniref:RRM domain-containing protein n=1 Tax=Meloidogyne enterolobii TaxID=390850 RepID=A0A6V7VXS0_MELEN|nr:unnamed protein product [Meloidogyne enterolobii]